MNNVQIIILAAGKGVRMNSDLPKVLVSLNDKPLIKRLLDHIYHFKTKQIVIVTGHKKDIVEKELGPQYTFAFQNEQLGTAHAVLAAKPYITAKNIVVLYGDMPFVTSESLKRLIALHMDNKQMFSMFTSTVPNFEDKYQTYLNFGRIVRDRGEIRKIQEFKDASAEEKLIKEVNPGIYVFNTDWLWKNIEKIKKNSHGEYYLTDMVELAISQGVNISTISIDPMEVYGINTPDQLKIAETLI